MSKLNEMGKAPQGWKFTLPTETQWEYAARGGNRSRSCTYSGSNDVNKVAWYNGGDRIYAKETHQVAQKKPNEIGLYDMSGNVSEWCLDDWEKDSSKLIAEFSRENDRDGLKQRAIRGGNKSDDDGQCRSAYRDFADCSKRYMSGYGLRLVLVPAGEGSTARTIVPADKTIDLSDDGKVKIEMMKVEAGTFEMSKSKSDGNKLSFTESLSRSDEIPHQVTLKQDFYIGRTEVTQAQWRAVMGTNPSYYRGDNFPVESVSWNNAMEFCEKLNEMGKAPTGWKFTLPTETQWEYAARGGNKSKGYEFSGSNKANEVAWGTSLDGMKQTHPVRKKKPNEIGLYDMSGNVSEWCLDDWEKDSSKLIAEFTRGNDQGGSARAIRGGSWEGGARGDPPGNAFRVANRGSWSPLRKSKSVGFRLALVHVQ